MFALAGCGGSVQHGCDLYSSGRYVDAALAFERTEDRLPEATPEERARYALYRGATFRALGDYERARFWLRRAARAVTKTPDVLEPGEARHLEQALRAVEVELAARGHRAAARIETPPPRRTGAPETGVSPEPARSEPARRALASP